MRSDRLLALIFVGAVLALVVGVIKLESAYERHAVHQAVSVGK